MALDGHCLCGNITYTCSADPVLTAVCHCTDCQHQTGSATSIIVGVPDDALEVSGNTLSKFTTIGEDHGTPTNRFFCSNCGSPIVSRVDAMPGMAWIKAGTLNDTSRLQPTVEVWCRSQQSWEEAIEGSTRFERGPA